MSHFLLVSAIQIDGENSLFTINDGIDHDSFSAREDYGTNHKWRQTILGGYLSHSLAVQVINPNVTLHIALPGFGVLVAVKNYTPSIRKLRTKLPHYLIRYIKIEIAFGGAIGINHSGSPPRREGDNLFG
jgi:hypothetical protein